MQGGFDETCALCLQQMLSFIFRSWLVQSNYIQCYASCEVFFINVLLPYLELGGFHSLAAPLSFEAAESDLQDRHDSWVC